MVGILIALISMELFDGGLMSEYRGKILSMAVLLCSYSTELRKVFLLISTPQC